MNIKKLSEEKTINGTSFYDDVFSASPQQLIDTFGPPSYSNNDGEGKINMEWELELGEGIVFTIYDWKEYRKLSMDEEIEWHIGAHDQSSSTQAILELIEHF